MITGLILLLACTSLCHAQTKTWDGKHDTSTINVTVVYFVPSDRNPLPDWKDHIEYYARRVTQFHAREFQGQSLAHVTVHPTPIISKWTTDQLRRGDADAIFFRTLGEVDERLKFGKNTDDGFPILLALSDINHRPLDDFYRLTIQDGRPVFEGILNAGNHFPGSKLGGARATYLADRGRGWGLVSADGWRVPYRGSDCVIYHEGLGHTVGLPHPEPGNRSVMSGAQYHGWLSESWIDDDQKKQLGWQPKTLANDKQTELFTEFQALPFPPQPRPGQQSKLKLTLPQDAKVESLRVRFQTSIDGPWIEASADDVSDDSEFVELAVFDRPTPVSYRVDVKTQHGDAELWGYFQVREEDNVPPLPLVLAADLRPTDTTTESVAVDPPGPQVNLLEKLDPGKCFTTGKWTKESGALVSSKGYGVRIEIPYTPPARYRMSVVVEPLDKPNGLLLGLRNGDQRFVALINYASGRTASSALENVDGRNVGNETTFVGGLLKQNQLSQVVVTVQPDRVNVQVDGRTIIDWKGNAEQLSLSDYWKTPNDKSIFLGTYDCAYRIHRVTVEPL
ncbi:MAG: hypothetical protein KDB00_23805 [Planctomycetales bacterium]|nr:hypothetical protein [Planctomycetales bacterium]